MRGRDPAFACLLAVRGCDKLRAMPGFQQHWTLPPPGPPALTAGPWLLDPLQGQGTVAFLTAQPSVGRGRGPTPHPGPPAPREGPKRTHPTPRLPPPHPPTPPPPRPPAPHHTSHL